MIATASAPVPGPAPRSAIVELLSAVDALDAGRLTGEARVRRALEDGFRAEGLVRGLAARAIAGRFCRAVALAEEGRDDEEIAAELEVSTKTIRRDREHVARLAAGSALLEERLLGGSDDD